jgi:mutator family transposase
LEDAEENLIAFYALPPEHWTKLRSTNPLERVNKEIGRRSDVVGIFPNDASVIRLAGALLSEQDDEWLVQRRYLFLESMALILVGTPNPENSLEQQPDLKEAVALNAAWDANLDDDEPGALHHLRRLDSSRSHELSPASRTDRGTQVRCFAAPRSAVR